MCAVWISINLFDEPGRINLETTCRRRLTVSDKDAIHNLASCCMPGGCRSRNLETWGCSVLVPLSARRVQPSDGVVQSGGERYPASLCRRCTRTLKDVGKELRSSSEIAR